MTTIAFKDGVMAADTLLVKSEIRSGEMEKIWRATEGIAGVSGSIIDALNFKRWSQTTYFSDIALVKVPYRDSDESHPHGFYVTQAGIFAWDGGTALVRIEAPFVAAGSGRELAIGAMAAGASAEEAVKVAAQFDVYTGGRITSLSLAREEPGAKTPDSAETRA